MLEALQPLDLHGAARALGVHPFEVVRLQVMSGNDDTMDLTASAVDALAAFGGIESWWAEAELPEDQDPRRRVVRGILDAMLQRDRIGDQTTRLDNLWRGLDPAQIEVAEQAIMVMIELRLLSTLAAPTGTQVSVHPEGLDAVKAVVTRGQAPPELAAVWQG